MKPDPDALDSFHISVPVTIRYCRAEDLSHLEWFGQFTEHREIIAQAYQRHVAGQNLMLVADARGFLGGQIWIDLGKYPAEPVGVLWALRVFPCFQRSGVGKRLIAEAEGILRRRGFKQAEIGVEPHNEGARSLYERLGYQPVNTVTEETHYTTPAGQQIRWAIEQVLLRKNLESGDGKSTETRVLPESGAA